MIAEVCDGRQSVLWLKVHVGERALAKYDWFVQGGWVVDEWGAEEVHLDVANAACGR